MLALIPLADISYFILKSKCLVLEATDGPFTRHQAFFKRLDKDINH